ncbi:MAG: 3'-5' exonuclease domain-containing protein 2 [Puniceicoccales bacterium]|nr:3'-5' exonuclease domain-containing protein 2 [Puniceicoccales bacterium]
MAHDGIRISKETIATLPLGQYTGRVVLVETPDAVPDAIAGLLKERVLGFDTETKPSFTRGVSYLPSLVQLAGARAVYLFRLDDCGGIPALFPIVRNPDILKVGVAVRDDVRYLKERAPFADAGFVEISDYTRRVGIENTGLRALAAHYLGLRISKGAQVSNWASKHLTPQQIVYAATDAWISRALYMHLEEHGLIVSGMGVLKPSAQCPVKNSSRGRRRHR